MMGHIKIRVLLATVAFATLLLAGCSGAKASRSASGQSRVGASAPAEASATSGSAAAAPTTASANAEATGKAAASPAMPNKAACKILKRSEMTAILGRPVEAIGFGHSAEYGCSFGAESTGSLPVSKSIPYYVTSGVELYCGADAKTMRQTWYMPNDTTQAPGARHDIRINSSVGPYFLMLPTGCAVTVSPAYDIHPVLIPDGNLKGGKVAFSDASKKAVVATLDAAYDRAV
jgi:hypothetical protein